MSKQQIQDPIKYAVKNEEVDVLCKTFFDIDLYPIQEKIVRDIAFQKNNRIILNTYTQYGKSFSIGVGLALRILFTDEDEKVDVGILGPTHSDAENVRDDMLEAGLESQAFANRIDTSKGSDPEDLKKSASQSLITLDDGNIRIECMSASSGGSGQGKGLMGSGVDLLVMDESNRIPNEVWKTNIARMLNSDDSVLIEAGNPFHKDNQFYQHFNDTNFTSYHVDEDKGIAEGRHSQEFFEEKAKDVGGRQSLEYKVLYESKFPDQVDNALIKHSWIEEAEKRQFDFDNPTIKYAADIADEGDDYIVLTRIKTEDNKYLITDQWCREKSSDTGDTARWIDGKVKEDPSKISSMVVDYTGIGGGVWSKLKELGYKPEKFKAGSNPLSEGDRFQNKKARNYFKVRDHLQDGSIAFKDNWQNKNLRQPSNKLVHELTHIKTERRAKDKVKIKDPDSGSPDFADSLMMAFYENQFHNRSVGVGSASVV